MINEAIYDILRLNSGVAALVGARIYSLRLPDKTTLPAIVYRISNAQHVESMAGSSGLCNSYIEISAWATTALAARDLGEQIRLALHGYTGTAGGIAVQGVHNWTIGELFEEETGQYELMSFCNVWHEVTKPI